MGILKCTLNRLIICRWGPPTLSFVCQRTKNVNTCTHLQLFSTIITDWMETVIKECHGTTKQPISTSCVATTAAHGTHQPNYCPHRKWRIEQEIMGRYEQYSPDNTNSLGQWTYLC